MMMNDEERGITHTHINMNTYINEYYYYDDVSLTNSVISLGDFCAILSTSP